MFQKITLSNGLRVLLAPLEGTKAITVLILFKVGSRYESKKINGISHFIEHMMFKGTKKRPSTLKISQELDSVGAEFNAFTGKDYTGYYVKIDAEKIKLALDLLYDMLFNSKFEEREIEKEKAVIIEEINMYEDNPLMYIEDLFEQSLYAGNTLSWLISGSRETVRGLDKKKILDYYREYYIPRNMILGVGGNINGKTIQLIKEYFSGLKDSQKQVKPFVKFKSKIIHPRVKIKFKETEQAQIALGFPGYSYFNPKIYGLTVLNVILGATMSSRLFIAVRERKSLAYFIKSAANVYEDTGNFLVQAGLDKQRIFEAIKIILEELKKIKKEGIKPAELKKARDCIKGKIILELEDSSHIIEWYARQELLAKKVFTPEEKLKKIFAVTERDVQKVAEDIIKMNQLNIAVIGPFKEEKDFLKVLRT